MKIKIVLPSGKSLQVKISEAIKNWEAMNYEKLGATPDQIKEQILNEVRGLIDRSYVIISV
jgi:hypothetical protein